MTSAFLDFSKSRGNDLSTPMPEFGFPGLKPGDRWCLCAPRWQEAFEANQAPRVILRATHEAALAYCSLADLKRFAVDLAWLHSAIQTHAKASEMKPKKSNKDEGRTATIMIRVRPSVKRMAVAMAKAEDRSLSSFISRLIEAEEPLSHFRKGL
jgi:hypothetical protein